MRLGAGSAKLGRGAASPRARRTSLRGLDPVAIHLERGPVMGDKAPKDKNKQKKIDDKKKADKSAKPAAKK